MADPFSLMAGAASIASAGLGAASSIMGGNAKGAAADAQAQGQEFMAQQEMNNAEIGRRKAAQTDAILRNNMMEQVSKIQAVRAGSNTSADSPSNQVLTHYAENVDDAERIQRVQNINTQVAADTASSRFYTSNAGALLSEGKLDVLSGYLGGGLSIFKDLKSSSFSGFGSGQDLPGMPELSLKEFNELHGYPNL
jgi:hypothetical protein